MDITTKNLEELLHSLPEEYQSPLDIAKALDAAQAAKKHLDFIMHMNPDAMSTFRINLTKNTLSDGVSAYKNLKKLQDKNTLDGYVEDALQFFPFESEKKTFSKRFNREHLIQSFLSGYTQVSMEHHYMLTDKNQRILNTIVSMIENKATKEIEGVVYTLDVTKQTYYSRINDLIFNSTDICIVVINIKTKTFIIPQVSPAIQLSATFEPQDYSENAFSIAENFVVETDREDYLKKCSIPSIIKKLDEFGEYSFPVKGTRDGKNVILEYSYYYMDENHEQIIGKAEDITKSAQRELDLKAALTAARKANNAKSDFLSNMSHDIRTPLNAIINLANLLYEEINEPDKLRLDIQKIEIAGEFLLQLINDVLDISAIESGRIKLVPRVYTYDSFLSYIKGIIVPLCENKDIHFILDEGPTSLDIYMDRVRFHQVFFNILSNAVKYTPPGGTVTFRTTNNVVHDGVLTCDFIVTDTGCGMSQDFITHAFEPFAREDSQNAYIGTGLGLTICKRILDLMGADIKIESEIGKGTKVTVHMDLQIATEAQKEQSQAELDSSHLRLETSGNETQQRILVVEDNEINQEILARLLEKKNYEVDTADNGKEAIEKIKNHGGNYYKLVLMDIRMPVMDGLEATALIRKNPDENISRIPIVAITANAFAEDAQECLDAGMNACLAKPISPASLYSMAATYLPSKSTTSNM
ncbi:MAG: response regulator [Lachnospiraceae bacterium]|nr:response regulator [Lachnospiraceae bacterium]